MDKKISKYKQYLPYIIISGLIITSVVLRQAFALKGNLKVRSIDTIPAAMKKIRLTRKSLPAQPAIWKRLRLPMTRPKFLTKSS